MSVILKTETGGGKNITVVWAKHVIDEALGIGESSRSPLLARVRFAIFWLEGERLVCCPFFAVKIPPELASCSRRFQLLLRGSNDPRIADIFLVEVESGLVLKAIQCQSREGSEWLSWSL